MAEIISIPMGPGEARVRFKSDYGLEDLLRNKSHLLFHNDERLTHAVVVVGRDPARGSYGIIGRLLPWWLGDETDGPVVIRQRYRAGTNKLSNGDFEDGEVLWSRASEDSKWSIGASGALAGAKGARTTGDFGDEDDDVLQSEETFVVEPGDVYRLKAKVKHTGGSNGSLRLRLLQMGRFKHPNLEADGENFSGDNWDLVGNPAFDQNVDPDHAYSGGGSLECRPSERPQLISNGGFESPLTEAEWGDITDMGISRSSTDEFKGDWCLLMTPDGSTTPRVFQNLAGEVKPGDELLVHLYVNASSDCDWSLHVRFEYVDEDGDAALDEVIAAEPDSSQSWTRYTARYTVPDDYEEGTTFRFWIGSPSAIGDGPGTWKIDEVRVRRVKGNVASTAWKDRTEGGVDSVHVVPLRTFRLTWKFRTELEEGVQGEVWPVIEMLGSPSGVTRYEEGTRRGPTKGRWGTLSWEFTPPSGYNRIRLHVFSQDIVGGSFYIDSIRIRDTDPTTRITQGEVMVDEATSTITHSGDHTITAGAQDARVEIAAEVDGGGWQVDDVSLEWVGDPVPATDVVADMVELSHLSVGTLHDAGDILFDLLFEDRTARSILDEISRTGVVQPAREFRCNPDGTVDWGLPEELYADRTDVILAADDVVLRRPPEAEWSDERLCDLVRVLGADLVSFRGTQYVVTGSAIIEIPADMKMWDGEPFARTHMVEDGSVNNRRYAKALAAAVAEDIGSERRSYSVDLADWRAWFDFDEGDWIYLHHPDEGIEDSSNPMPRAGETLYPERVRVLGSTVRMGNDWRCELRRGPGDVIDITDQVIWEKSTSASLELGDPRPSFLSNPQGGAVGKQFLRFRRSRSHR